VTAVSALLVLSLLPAALALPDPPIEQQVGPTCVPVIGGVLGGDTCLGLFVHLGPDGLHSWFILPCGVGNLVDNCGLALDADATQAHLVVTPQLGCRQVCVPSLEQLDVLLPGSELAVTHTTCVLSLCGVEDVEASAAGVHVGATPVPCVLNVCAPRGQATVGTNGSVNTTAEVLCGPAAGGACLLAAGLTGPDGTLFLQQDVVGAGPVVELHESVTPAGAVDAHPNPSCFFAIVGGVVICQNIDVSTGALLGGDVHVCALVHLYGSVNLNEAPCFP